MKGQLRFRDDPQRLLNTLALVNASIWVISMIALIILMQDAPAVKKLAPILICDKPARAAS